MSIDHYVRRPGGEHTRNVFGARFTFLADAADTAGAYSVIDTAARPGQEPAPHTHAHEDEAFYILDGDWTFYCGDATTEAEPGALVFLPRGRQHHFTLHGELGRALVIISPGGLESVFRELSEPMPEGDDLPPMLGDRSPFGDVGIGRVLEALDGRGVQFAPPPATG